MPHELKWSKHLELHVPKLDAQHRRLVELAGELARLLHDGASAAELAGQLAAVAKFITHHFAEEERLMKQFGFPSDGIHIGHHRELLDQFSRFSRRLVERHSRTDAKKAIEFLKHWVYHHITHSDRKLAQHLLAQGVTQA